MLTSTDNYSRSPDSMIRTSMARHEDGHRLCRYFESDELSINQWVIRVPVLTSLNSLRRVKMSTWKGLLLDPRHSLGCDMARCFLTQSIDQGRIRVVEAEEIN